MHATHVLFTQKGVAPLHALPQEAQLSAVPKSAQVPEQQISGESQTPHTSLHPSVPQLLSPQLGTHGASVVVVVVVDGPPTMTPPAPH